jgi:hypothetical protein
MGLLSVREKRDLERGHSIKREGSTDNGVRGVSKKKVTLVAEETERRGDASMEKR